MARAPRAPETATDPGEEPYRELSIAERWADDEGLVGLDADEDLLVPIFGEDGTVTSGAERAAARRRGQS